VKNIACVPPLLQATPFHLSRSVLTFQGHSAVLIIVIALGNSIEPAGAYSGLLVGSPVRTRLFLLSVKLHKVLGYSFRCLCLPLGAAISATPFVKRTKVRIRFALVSMLGYPQTVIHDACWSLTCGFINQLGRTMAMTPSSF